jgi:penicillin-binding protein 2
VVERIGDEVVGQPEVTGSLPVSPETLTIIQEAMLGVTTSSLGTATHRFSGLGILVAGKTGTAEAPGADSEPHSWFAAFAPADAPEIAIVVMAENAGEGSEVAAPMARQVVEAYYGLPLTPLPPPPEETLTPTPDGGP